MRWFSSLLGLMLLALVGCAETRYYWQSVSGHLEMMQSARPVAQWLADEQAPAPLKQRLEMAQRMRSFAVAELGLPDNASYQRYADTRRRAVVWNVVAAPAFSLRLKTWCFPVMGCVSYRGYFSEEQAQTLAGQLRAEGMETSVYGVPAYSTLGWMNWAGGDPLLNTFITYPEGELGRIIFHELAHQQIYVADDSMFNESFATAVEQLGAVRWLEAFGSAAARGDYRQGDARRRQFRALTLATRDRLRTAYAVSESPEVGHKAALKKAAMQDFRDRYAELRRQWGGYSGYDQWVASANNASFGAQSTYDELVPAFETLFENGGASWPRFYEAVRQLAAMAPTERSRALLGRGNEGKREAPGG